MNIENVAKYSITATVGGAVGAIFSPCNPVSGTCFGVALGLSLHVNPIATIAGGILGGAAGFWGGGMAAASIASNPFRSHQSKKAVRVLSDCVSAGVIAGALGTSSCVLLTKATVKLIRITAALLQYS